MIVHPLLKQGMPQELDSVAGLRPAGKPGTAPDQLRFLQLGKVLLCLAVANANLLGESADGGKAPAVLPGVARQPAVSHLGPRRHQIGADQGFRNKNAGEEPEGIEWLADLRHIWPLVVLWLGHDLSRKLTLGCSNLLIQLKFYREGSGCGQLPHGHSVDLLESAVVTCTGVRAASMAIRRASAAARRPSSSATWGRSAGRCSTASTSTWKCPPCPTKSCAVTPPPNPRRRSAAASNGRGRCKARAASTTRKCPRASSASNANWPMPASAP